MSNPLVSIIISAYNHEKYIHQCLNSIVNQTYKNIELIILNDGSIDNTHYKIKIIENRLKKRFINYVYINNKHSGICRNLNIGLHIAKGKYIICFSSDDVMLPQRVQLQVEYLERHKNYGLIYTDGYLVFSDGTIDMYKNYDNEQKFSSRMEFRQGYLFEFMLKNLLKKPTPSICASRECYDKVGFYDETMSSEDPDMFLRMSKVEEIGNVKKILTLHRVHPNNSGARADIIIPTFNRMKEKYINSPMLTDKQRKILFRSFERYLEETRIV